MGFKCGIVGLPNVGKSTLFNALTQTATAQAANYPFCTIEPNIGDVMIPDPRLSEIANLAGSRQMIHTRLNFVDIAGLVRGASKGEGLGNQFLGHIREIDAVAYVLRCFQDDDITHVEGRINPLLDAQIIKTELMLADMETLEKKQTKLEKQAKRNDEKNTTLVDLVAQALALLRDGKPAQITNLSTDESEAFQSLNLLTAKPALYVCNVDEASAATGNEFSEIIEKQARNESMPTVIISAKLESDLVPLTAEEKNEYLRETGLSISGFEQLIRAGYDLLQLVTFFTAGPKETRAWTIPQGTYAPQAARVIHTDLERGFIRAQTIAFNDYITYKGETGAKDAGKARDEGKGYIVREGDIILFKFSV
ncbi:MAG: redox-regulated ATPase YchF [Alphaproteobacteria bacterium]|nr:redox-regulated ATPase YchF [Alphaproteobacteria bacterium]